MPIGTRHERTSTSHSASMQTDAPIKSRWRYAWHGAGPRWDALPLQAVGSAVGGFLFWYLGVKVPQEILDNPALGALFAIFVGGVAGVVVVFIARLCWWPVYRRYHPLGGFVPYLKAKLGVQMWPSNCPGFLRGQAARSDQMSFWGSCMRVW